MRLTNQLKSQVLSYLQNDAEIDSYAQEFEKEFVGKWESIDQEVFFNEIAGVDVILGGDFHGFSQAQRSHLRILRSLPKDRPIVLAMECLPCDKQSVIDDYLAKRITDKAFLQKIMWSSNWGFPWQDYKPLFEFARANNVKIIGVSSNTASSGKKKLTSVDQFIAKKIIETLEQGDRPLVYLVVGELHLIKKKLFSFLKKNKSEDVYKIVRIFLNSERLYFKNIRKIYNRQEILKSAQDKYCIQSSPPWVKWQNYLMYLEKTYDHPLSYEQELEFTDHVLNMVKLIAHDLNLKLDFSDLSVDSTDSYLNDENKLKLLSLKTQKKLVAFAETEKSFYLPERKTYFLARPSVNHCATLAGLFVHAKVSKIDKLVAKNKSLFFLQLVWVEAMAFCLSKLVNHKRKPDNFELIQKKVALMSKNDRGFEPLFLVVQQKLNEVLFLNRRKLRKLKTAKEELSYHIAAKHLGSMLGEKVFLNFKEKKVNVDDLLDLLSIKFDQEDFIERYYFVLSKIHRSERSAKP